jgi:hypothetical protein
MTAVDVLLKPEECVMLLVDFSKLDLNGCRRSGGHLAELSASGTRSKEISL